LEVVGLRKPEITKMEENHLFKPSIRSIRVMPPQPKTKGKNNAIRGLDIG
jgi:hypothetical protein